MKLFSLSALALLMAAFSAHAQHASTLKDTVITPGGDTLMNHCGSSLTFNDTSINVNLPASNRYYSGTNGGYTWECWFRLNQPIPLNIAHPLISGIDWTLFEDQYLGFGWDGGWFDEPANKLVFRVDGPSSTAPSFRSCSYAPPGDFVVGTWYMATGVADYEDHVAKLYVNGVAVDSVPLNVAPITRIIPMELSDGWNPADLRPLPGNMDEVRIWDVALSDAQVRAQYDHCLSGNESNLFLYYRCNDFSGNTVADASPNGNTGTFALSGIAGWSTDEPLLAGNDCENFCAVVPPIPPVHVEICGNDIDDDGDGLIDEDCPCPVITTNNPLLPNVFTPNNDGENDVFKFDNRYISKLDCKIYDRWGLLIYEMNDPADTWNGKTKSGKECPEGVYFYILNGTNKCSNKDFKDNGYIQLLK